MKLKGQTVISDLENYYSAQNHRQRAALVELGNVHYETEIRIWHFECESMSEG